MKILIFGDISNWNISDFELSKIPSKYLEIIKSADQCIYNLEGPILNDDPSKYDFIISENRVIDYFWKLIIKIFRKEQPKVFSTIKILPLLKLNENTVVNLANNHIKDFGVQGLKDTISLLKENKINFVGAGFNKNTANKPLINIINGKEIIIISSNYVGLNKWGMFANIYGAKNNSFGASYLNINQVSDLLYKFRNKDSKNRIIILLLHAGREMKSNLEQTQLPINEFRNLDANLIIFHHPHQHLDIKSDDMFLLGDFIFYRPNSKIKDNRLGAFLEYTISRSKLIKFRFNKGYPIS